MGIEPTNRDALLALLDFYVASGVDLALDETPHDRFAEGEDRPGRPAPALTEAPRDRAASETRSPEMQPRSASLPRAATASPEAVAADAGRLAAAARTLAELEEAVAVFEGCALRFSARQIAFSDGAPGSRVMVLGDAPGSEEDRTGRPFVGRAGQLLDRMLAAIGLDRTSVYMANVVPWRPPGDRPLNPHEIVMCLPFTLRQIELSAPEFVLSLGSLPTNAILGSAETIGRLRGRWFDWEKDGRRARVLPTLHPARLLERPVEKRVAWRDLRLLRRTLDGNPLPPR